MAALRLKLYSHLFMQEPALPPMPAPLVYVVAGNGVHLWAKRDGLEALIPVQPCAVRDLYPVQPFVRLDGLPLVEARLVQQMLLRGKRGAKAGRRYARRDALLSQRAQLSRAGASGSPRSSRSPPGWRRYGGCWIWRPTAGC